MIIEKIHINCFGNLNDRTFELCDGVNIIEGANESGKSTVAAFIKFVFYGLSSRARDHKLSERDRYINWLTGNAGGYVIIRTKDARFRIERTLSIAGQKTEAGETRKNYRESLQVIDLSNNSPVSGINSPGEYFFGVDEDIFVRTAFIGQLEGAKVEESKLSESIENILFSANENVNIAKALKKLDASRVALLHKNGAGGQIHELEVKCTQLEAKLDAAKQVSAEILEKESSLREAKKKYEETVSRRELLGQQIKGFENTTVTALFDKLHEIEAKHEKCKMTVSELTAKYTVSGFLPNEEYILTLENAINKYKASKEELLGLEAELEKAKAELNNTEQTASAPKNITNDAAVRTKALSEFNKLNRHIHSCTVMTAIFAAISLVFIIGGTASVHFSFFAEIGKILLFSALLPLLLALVFFGVRAGASAQKHRFFKKHGAADEEEFKKNIEAADEKERDADIQNDRIRLIKEQYKCAHDQTAVAESELKAADTWKIGENAEDDLKTARLALAELERAKGETEKLSAMLDMIKAQLKPYNEDEVRNMAESADLSQIDETNITAKRREYDFTSKAADALEVRIHELEKALAALYPRSDNPARIAEKLELAHSFISEYKKKHSAYLLAAQKLEEAGGSMRESLSPKLAELTSRLMSTLTEGKYSEIGISPDLKINVRTEAGSRELAYLSAGTQDIAYVSLRLALINTLFRKGLPCAIFDESFSRLDDTRLEQILKLMYTSRATMQSILLTSSSRDARLMNNVGEYGYIKID